jgi:hypothetical protein
MNSSGSAGSSAREPVQQDSLDAAGLSDDQVERLANLIAEGKCELPEELSRSDCKRVEDATRRRLRDRLSQLFVRALSHRLSTKPTVIPREIPHV